MSKSEKDLTPVSRHDLPCTQGVGVRSLFFSQRDFMDQRCPPITLENFSNWFMTYCYATQSGFFYQFCDIKILTTFFKTLAKSVDSLKNPHSFLVKKTTKQLEQKNTYPNEVAPATTKQYAKSRHLKLWLLRGREVDVGKNSHGSIVQTRCAFIVIIEGTFDEVV